MSYVLGREQDSQQARPGFGTPWKDSEKSRDTQEPAPLVVDPHTEGHWLCVAPMGAGKTASFVVPQLLNYEGPVVALDIKGELVSVTARARAERGPVLVFDPFAQVSNGAGQLDPLSHLDVSSPGLADDVYAIASLFGNPTGGGRAKDAFWEDWGQDVVAGAIMAALFMEDPAERTLAKAYQMLNSGDTVYNLAVVLDQMGAKMPDFVTQKLGGMLSMPDVTRGGVLSSAQQQVRMLAGEGVQRALGGDSIDMGLLTRGEPCTIYLVVPPDKLVSHASLIRILLTSMVQRMLRRREAGRYPTMLLIDEAAQVGRMPSLETAITLGRSYGIRTALIVQSLAQLKDSYGKAASSVIENCSMITMGRHLAFSMSSLLAREGFGDVSPEQLFSMSADEAMVRVRGEASRKLHKIRYFSDPLFTGMFDANPFYDPPRGAA